MKTKIIKSSGNVFADLDVTEPDQALAKAELAHQISSVIQSRNINQTKAAEILGITRGSLRNKLRTLGIGVERVLRASDSSDGADTQDNSLDGAGGSSL